MFPKCHLYVMSNVDIKNDIGLSDIILRALYVISPNGRSCNSKYGFPPNSNMREITDGQNFTSVGFDREVFLIYSYNKG